ncbi:Tetracenomycin polyketide synthesis 8-O-methyl transferase tcmO [Tetrabaena socialis]|uniref:Tetracenomycin polyketide synthesis 8-O-methyl transferase tcmO n=1 Tax=Tetrabaena socialis TaxID=47790 RepID=A0A2J8A6U0_9CHLO|nr:Tetracenomycin polyketide synthesis 8-O-methyl transferase tcmO [Tetrabaena socialis]|eukprot:PNH08238.1 Tetracenomycin polyketide synthesis 8-O-methyl transferase tcmO [Tetrabaena socialis]
MIDQLLRVEGLPDLLLMSRLFKVSAALNTAAKLGLFTALDKHKEAGATAQQLSADLGLCQCPGFRAAADFLDLLVSVGCLERAGDGPVARYRNAAVAERHLVKGGPEYVAAPPIPGGILCLNSDRSYPMFEYLAPALQQGEMPAEAFQRVPDIHTIFGSDDAAAEFFADGMTGASLGNFELLAQRFPFGRFASLGDLGGSSGCLACCVAKRHTHMSVATYDLPPVHAAAERYVAAQGCGERVQVRDYDFFSPDPVPGAHDVLTLGMVLHDWGLDKKLLLMRKAHAALPAGGALIAIDNLIDDERRSSPVQLGMSLNMLLEFGRENAFDYTFKEFTDWATLVGFQRVELIALAGTTQAAVAYK